VSIDKQETSTESRLQWLDEELRQAKAALHKVEHELEQALNQIWNLDSGLRKLEEGSGDSGGTAAALPGIQEEIRQLRSQADKLQDRQNALAGRSEELGRQQQADLERERQERAALLKQAEAAARSVGQFESRIQLLEESLRHVEESVAELRLSHQTLTREIEELTNRSARNLETALRLEHQAAGLAGEIEALQKRDGEIEDRVNLFEERIHRSEERVDKFEQHLSLPLDIKEQLDRGRFERQQLAERTGEAGVRRRGAGGAHRRVHPEPGAAGPADAGPGGPHHGDSAGPPAAEGDGRRPDQAAGPHHGEAATPPGGGAGPGDQGARPQ